VSNGAGEAGIAEFWTWFAQHSNDLAQACSDTSPVLDELLQSLHGVHPDLYFEICTNSDPRELIVTAEGRRELFPLADVVVAAAPRIEGWVFTALKPPMGFEFQTRYEGTTFDPRSMWFLPLESQSNPAALGLRVGIPEFVHVQEKSTKNAILVILDTALGERSAASDIQHVEVTALPAKPDEQGYIELTELADYIAWKKRKRAHPS
jgi:hypothetical protein